MIRPSRSRRCGKRWRSCDSPESWKRPLKRARAALRDPADARAEVLLRLEIAKILDRVGLHTNTRPVEAALEEIELAGELARALSASSRGAVSLAKAWWYYRAEMAEREFINAEKHAVSALGLLELAGDVRARSDAAHQLGLIHMQRGELERARELFDWSLELDREAGERKWMLGEYHRHVAFVYALSGDWEASLPHFEWSLRYRVQAGAVDASLFAAVSLGRALVRTGNPAEAETHLKYAIGIAQAIPSPVGVARASLVVGQMHEALGNTSDAIAAYTAAARVGCGGGPDRSRGTRRRSAGPARGLMLDPWVSVNRTGIPCPASPSRKNGPRCKRG